MDSKPKAISTSYDYVWKQREQLYTAFGRFCGCGVMCNIDLFWTPKLGLKLR